MGNYYDIFYSVIYFIITSNKETFIQELLENHKEMFSLYYIHNNVLACSTIQLHTNIWHIN